ncbi:MAG: SPFH/Band 7/PHB domain protein [Alphaproteobacteria bacterium]|nr:SPFH/Band 7/PHB domain protein [Alphaproteobacteria bacterium]
MEIIAITVVIIGILFVFQSVQIVSQGFEYTVERFGRYTETLKPGLHIIMPFIDRIGAKVNMMEQVMAVPSQDVITKDNAVVTVDGIIFYQILDAAQSAYEVSSLKNAIMNLTMTNIRTVMGSMDLDELLSHREKINARLLMVVDEATNPWGTKVTRIEILDIKPPRDLVDSMARQMKAEREKRALILEAEGERQSAILAAEGSRQANILKAEGLQQAMVLEAEGRKDAAHLDGQARERLAMAEARATIEVSQAVAQGSSQALNYFVAQKYVEAFHALAKAPNQKVILMPMETSGLLSSIAGVAELAKEAFAKDAHDDQSADARHPEIKGRPTQRPTVPSSV